MRVGMILCLLMLSPGNAHGSEIRTIRVLEAGIYTARTVNNFPGSSGPVQAVDSIRLLESTTVVPASKGVRFGFRYLIIGASRGQTIELDMVTVFPTPGLRVPGSQTASPKSLTNLDRTVGVIAFRGYQFDQDWEILPGRWSFEFWYRGRKLGKQDFCVVPAWPTLEQKRDSLLSCSDMPVS